MYVGQINNVTCFDLALHHVAIEIFGFRRSCAIEQVRPSTASEKFSNVNDLMVGQLVRILMVSNLQRIFDLLHESSD